MSNQLEQHLKLCTGHVWRKVSPTYLDFCLRHSKGRPLCVFTSDDIANASARLFVPEQATSHELHRPVIFVQKYLAKVKNSLPAIKVDLSTMPGMTLFLRILMPNGYKVISLILKLDGDLVLKNKKSTNLTTISPATLKSLTVNAQIAINETIAKLSGHYNFEKNEFVLSAAGVGEFVSDNVSITPKSFSASMTPKPIQTYYGDWLIEGQLGYEVDGSIDEDKNEPPVQESININDLVLTSNEAAKLGITMSSLSMIGLLLIFILL